MLDICHTSLGTPEFGVGTFVLTLSAGIIANRMTADRAWVWVRTEGHGSVSVSVRRVPACLPDD